MKADFKDPKSVLQEYWGYPSFRPLQEDIILSALRGKDTLALLPTGGGKSICFQVPGLAKPGICLVVSPLIALMKDQVYQLQKRGIPAEALYSGMTAKHIDRVLDNAIHGSYRFLYLSPERLVTPMARQRIAQMPVNLIAVDESHCISQWGYDFRPPYLRIAEIRELHPKVPVLAVTATATPRVTIDIMEKLAFEEHHCIQASFARSNLAYVVRKTTNKREKMLHILHTIPGSSVVYVRNRRKTKEMAAYLQHKGISASYYHAGLQGQQREKRQEDWIEGKTRVIVATNAFGMGIDKADVRTVIHLDLPDTIEAYFQEAGRAGRDEKKAYAVLLCNDGDERKAKDKIEHTMPTEKEVKTVYNALGNYFQLPVGQGKHHAFPFDIKAFCKRFSLNIVRVHHALRFLSDEGYLYITESVHQPATVYIHSDRESLYRFRVKNKPFDALLKYLLRTYGGILDGYVRVYEHRIAKHFNTTAAKVKNALNQLHKLRVLYYDAPGEDPKITYLEERLPIENVQLNSKHIEERKQIFEEKLGSMLHYAFSGSTCRSRLLLAYFGETDAPVCGQCDVCKAADGMNDKAKIEALLWPLFEQKKVTLGELKEASSEYEEEAVRQIIDEWLEDGRIQQTEDGSLKKVM